MQVHERVIKVRELIEEVKAHPMCFKFEDDGKHFWVLYPAGNDSIDGSRIDYKAFGKIDALERLLTHIQKDWMESYPGSIKT